VLKNIASNIFGTILPSAAALIAVPFIIRDFGLEMFGIFSLQVSALFFFGLTDFGISRAIVLLTFDSRFAGDMGWVRPYKVGVRYTLRLCIGLCLLSPLVYVLRYWPPHGVDIHDLTRSSVIILLSSALMLGSLPARAVLEAEQEFFLLNIIRGPTAASIFLAPLIAFEFDRSLTAAAVVIFVTRLMSIIAYYLASGAYKVHFQKVNVFADVPVSILKEMNQVFLKRASWLGMINVLSLGLSYIERVMLGFLQSALAVGQFVIAQEVATKLWIASGAVVSASTPRLANAKGAGDPDEMARTTRQLVIIMIAAGVLPAIILIMFGETLLKLWLRKEFTEAAVFPLKVMAAGVGLNNLTQVNFTLLQVFEGEFGGAMLQIFNLLFSAITLAVFIPFFGVIGAAYAFSLRLLVDAFIVRYLLDQQGERGKSLGVSYMALVAMTIGFLILLCVC
jgi:O-antigen/teichoic acid export membrane protein